MVKSSKKSTIEIAPAAVSVPPSKLAKNGKRDAEVVLEKPVSAKKQRKVVVDVQTKQNVDKKPKKIPAPKKKTETSSSEDTSSDSEEEVKIAPKKVGKPVKLQIKDSSSSEESSSDEVEVKPANSFKKLPVAGVKKAISVASKKKEDSSDEDSDSSSDEKNKSVAASKKPPVAVKSVSFNIDSDKKQDVTAKAASIVKKPTSKVMPNASKKKEESSESSSSDSDSDSDSDDEDDAPKVSVTIKSGPTALKAAVSTAAKMKDESSDSSESDSDSDEEVPPAIPQKKPEVTQKVPPAIIPPKRPEATQKKPPNKAKVEESSEDSSDESASESDEEQRKKLKVPESTGLNASKSTMKGAKKESSSSDEDEDDSSEESSDEEPQRKKLKVPESTGLNASKPTMKGVKKESSSSDEDEDDSSEESSDEETPKAQQNKPITPPTKQPIKSSSSDEESEDDSSDESEEELPVTTPAKKETDLKREDAPTDQTAKNFDKRVEKVPADNQSFSSGSKILFVGNLSFDAGDDEIMEFFKGAGEVTGIRLARFDDGQVKGFGHVEFATPEAAQKALHDLNGQELLGRAVKLDLARERGERGERGSYTPNYGMGNKSFQKAEKGQSNTIFVRGFDNSLEMNQIQSSLEEYFGSCGEITRISLPRDYETGGSKGIGYLDFRTEEAFSKALELSGSELGGYTLTVEEAKPKGDGGSGGRGGGWSGGRSGGRGGRGGRDGGGWGGGRGGGRGRDGGGYRGRGNGRGGGGRYGAGTQSQGKKTTFSDD